ncbi:putative mitochondrial DNA polymerase I protein B [Trypanosoma conorhini]|uniref:DNA-directed DNA polymerase n=1 Tax=Trypanosoma conorhini TaxID=83891 RepID=A0A3R7P389_9TRYP|nr:putative mitochondrial DNA polymerase I protein B [Trypanosoma conorhini]RNF16514.1 putative mitochondrial DNA polymerase I protein B [Trypanosoma conorhini]
MRRLLARAVGLVGGLRRAFSFPALLNTQAALQKAAPLTNDAEAFAEFFRVPVLLDAGVAESVRQHYERVVRGMETQQDSHAVRVQEEEQRRGEELPVFLVSYDLRSRRFHFFSIERDRVVVVAGPPPPAGAEARDCDGGDHTASGGVDLSTAADELMQHTHGLTQMILLPIVAHKRERDVLAPHFQRLLATLRQSGLLPVLHVDNLELAAALDPDPPPLREVVANYAVVTPTPLSEQWFRAHWVYLRTLACRMDEEDPIRTINRLIVPRFDVFVIHLVRSGSRGLNIVLWDPAQKRRYAARGMLSDILACLLERHSKRIIFLPTNRTDRPTLLRCRAAMAKAGRQCQVVFASELGEKYRGVYQSEPSRFWASLREVSGGLDMDFLFEVYVTAGNSLRSYHVKRLREGEAKPVISHRAEETAACVTATEVEKWLGVLSLDRRVAKEKAEMRKYKRHLFIAYVATEFAAYTRPANPHAAVNFVVAAALMDAQHRVLEPWTKYAARGDFTLPALDEFDVLVCHDAKQLLLLVWDDPELLRFLKRGGRVWCTMLAEYILEAQRCQTGGNNFRDVALKYGVMTPPCAVLGIATVDLPFAFLRHYLSAAVDALSVVFREQLSTSCERSQVICLAHRMDSLLAMASIESAGIHIDAAEAARQAQAVRNRLLAIDKALSLYLPSEVPADLQRLFDWNSLQHLGAFLFGGSITLGYTDAVPESAAWTSHLVHFCHRYGSLSLLSADVHLQRFASERGLRAAGRLPQRVAQHLARDAAAGLRKYRLVVFDVESTGLNTATDAIIEVAAWDPVEGTSFSSLVDPERPIPQATMAIHHITNGMVRGAPRLPEVTRAFARFLRLDEAQRDPNEVTVLVGHNVFALDEPLLRRAFEREGVAMDSILFCDSLALLKALKRDLQGSTENSRVDRGVLEILTTSLRLSSLVEGLHVEAEGALHRADTDAKTLWFVLVNALGLAGREVAKQRDAVFSHAARTLVTYPGTGCFLPLERRRDRAVVRLPGVASQVIDNPRQLASLRGKLLNENTLQTLHRMQLHVAGLLLQKQQLERNAARFLHADPGGRLSVLHPDCRVRQCIDLTATTTSRTTSSYPSCQNIPKDDKSPLRRLFISRFGAQGRCVELDYSQLEIVVLALLCGDSRLVSDLNRGVDFHVKRASFFSGVAYDEIYDGYQRGVAEYVQLRKTAKTFSFQRLYGAGVPLLHKTTGIPVKDLEASIRKEEEEYPGIAQFHRLVRAVALRAGNPGLPTHFVAELPTGLRMSFKTRDVVLNLPPVKNYPIQGFGAELAQMMVGRVFRQFVRRDFYGQKAFMINFVHDSLWLDCHVDVLEECVRETRARLVEVHTYVAKAFPGVELRVPLRVTTQCGVDMCSMETFTDDFSRVASQGRSAPAEVEPLPGLDGDTADIIENNV